MGPILNSRNVGKVCEYNVIFLHVCFLRIHVDHNIALGRLLINPCYIIYIGDVKFVVGNSNYDWNNKKPTNLQRCYILLL